MKFPLDWLILNKWYWITVFGCFAVMIGPLITIYLILLLPATVKAITLVSIIIGWGVAGGYKDWIKARRTEEKFKLTYMDLQPRSKRD